jgi:hypothetical protein
MKFTAQQKLEAVERELGFRKLVYPRRVKEGKMSQQEANRQIALFAEIAADYERESASERLL